MTRAFVLALILLSAWPAPVMADTRGSHSTDELLERVTAFASAHPDRLYYSLSDFIAEGLKGLCSES